MTAMNLSSSISHRILSDNITFKQSAMANTKKSPLKLVLGAANVSITKATCRLVADHYFVGRRHICRRYGTV